MGKSSISQLQVEVSLDHLTIDGCSISISKNISFIEEIQPRGSNGIVFKAKDTTLNRQVAVKIWIPKKRDPRNRRIQALAEASKLAQLSHNNIVQIYQCSELANGFIYSVMEYLGGTNLDDFLLSNNPDFDQRRRLWSDINEGISYAHSKGIYHGDLHAGNIRVVNDTVKLLDFGTSLFAGKQIETSRESKFIIRIAKMLFPNIEPRLSGIADFNLSSLKPSLVLATVSSWISILSMCGEIESVIDEIKNSAKLDDLLRHRMHSMAGDISFAPVLSVEKLIVKLNAMGVPSFSQDVFLNFCVIWAETILSDSRKSSFPARNRRENEVLLKTLWPNLLAAFLTRGPFL